VQHVLLTHNYGDTKSLLNLASLYAARAVEAGPTLPETHLSLASVLQMRWDWRRSEEEYLTAIQIQERLARAYVWYAGLVLQFGRLDECLAISRKGLELDPFDYPSHRGHGFCLWQAGRLREAAAHLEDLLTKIDDLYAHAVLGQVYAGLAAGSAEPESTEFFIKSLGQASTLSAMESEKLPTTENAGYLKWSDTVFAQAHAARGDKGSARYYIDRLEHGLASGSLSASAVAWAHAAAGNVERTLELIEAGAENQEREMLYVKVHPLFRPLRGQPRFKAVLHRMNLGGDESQHASA
jgi:tetratricopeptide (TPR) repeat protein